MQFGKLPDLLLEIGIPQTCPEEVDEVEMTIGRLTNGYADGKVVALPFVGRRSQAWIVRTNLGGFCGS